MPKCVLLLSGGIDSAVAGHFVLSGGAELLALHFSTVKVTGKESIEKAKKICQILGLKKLFVCEASSEFAELTKKCEHRYYFVLMKRVMLKTAVAFAKKQGAEFIVTGESLGQVSSQTLSNLSAIDRASSLPVLRPVLSFDKQEIIDTARKIGTLEASTGKEMCDALGPKHPATKVVYEKILEEEQKLPTSTLEKKIMEQKLAD